MSLIKALLGAAMVLGALAPPALAQTPDKLKIAVTQRGAWDTAVAEMGQRAGIFKKHGLDVEILYTQAGPEAIQALIAGSVDVATGAGVGAAVGTISKGAPLKIISSEILGAPDQYWYVPAESPVKTIADLNGKTISFSLPGSSSNAALLARQRYSSGLIDFQTVLDTQRTQLSAQDSLAANGADLTVDWMPSKSNCCAAWPKVQAMTRA